MNDFTTVFLFTNNTKEINDFILRDFASSIIGIFFLIYSLFHIWRKPRKWKWKFSAIALSFLLVIIGTVSCTHSIKGNIETKNYFEQKYQHLLNIYNNHQYEVAEGNVHVLHIEPFSGHAEGDIINVGGVEFEISFFELAFGYKQTIAHNGILKEGVYARVYHTNGIILRIDLKNPN